MAERPRILLVPSLTELEWAVRPLLEEWAEVASYDAPGLDAELPPGTLTSQAAAEAGLAELDRLGWGRAIVVGDELGSLAAVLLASRRPESVAALVLGHPIVSLDMTSDARPLNEAVIQAHVQLAGTSFRAFVREQFRAWMGLHATPAAGADERAEQYLARVPHEAANRFYAHVLEHARRYEALLRDAFAGLPEAPVLLVAHEGCLMFTHEGFEQAAEALPQAETATTQQKPSVDPAFAERLREFVERQAG